MTHKCANEGKCEITPFTRNSCQYCRLKKCFEVGMSREASRLGRRPKKLKEVSGESSRGHTVNQPIAPYPSQAELHRLRMAELQKLLQQDKVLKSEHMQALLITAQASFREHAKSNTGLQQQKSNSGSAAVPVISKASTSAAAISNSPVMSPDVNLNISANVQGGNINLKTEQLSGSASPMPDLSFDNLSPQSFGDFYPAAFNDNTLSSPNSQLNDNIPSPLDLPPLDNLDPTSPSNFFNVISGTTGFDNVNLLNMNMSPDPQQQHTTTTEEVDTKTNLNINNINTINSTSTTTTLSGASVAAANLNNNPTLQKAQSPVIVKQEPEEELSVPPQSDTSIVDIPFVLNEVKKSPPQGRRLLIDQVTDIIVGAHHETTINTHGNVARANAKIAKEKENKTSEDLPDISKLTLSAADMWQMFLNSMVPEITRVVKFFKKLPGFGEVNLEDQMRLIKQGTFEVMLARFSILVDEVKEEMLDPTLTMKSPKAVVLKMPMGHFLGEFFSVAKMFNPLRLTDGEIGLFTAILMMCPTRKGLVDPQKVETLQLLFLQALYLLMKTNRQQDAENTFKSLLNMMPVFRRINEEHYRSLNDIKMVRPNEFPQLHQEVFDEPVESS